MGHPVIVIIIIITEKKFQINRIKVKLKVRLLKSLRFV